jgi:hypothetical protein
MPIDDPLALAGQALGVAGLTYATFVATSFLALKDKIDAQLAAGEDPYELNIEEKTPTGQGGKGKKAPASGKKRRK